MVVVILTYDVVVESWQICDDSAQVDGDVSGLFGPAVLACKCVRANTP